MNKILKVILNILIGIAVIVLLACIADLIESVKYANRDDEDSVKTYAGVFEYKLDNRAYGEIMSDYYVKRMSSFTPDEGYEDLYRVAEYGHTAFMSRVYEEKGDSGKAALCREKTGKLRRELGVYEYTADEIDAMIEKAP